MVVRNHLNMAVGWVILIQTKITMTYSKQPNKETKFLRRYDALQHKSPHLEVTSG